MILVTGVIGAGKSTLCERAAEKLGEPYSVVNFGRIMSEVAEESGVAKSIAELRQKDMATYRRVMLDACDEIANRGPHLLVDSRCLLVTTRGYLPGLPAEIMLNFEHTRLIVLVEGDPVEILARRRHETGKPWYGAQAAEEVARQQELARSYAVAASFATGVPLCVIQNRDGLSEQSCDEMLRAIRDEEFAVTI